MRLQVIFPSMVGSQLECVESPIEGWGDGSLIIMNEAALGAGFVSGKGKGFTVQHNEESESHELSNVFLEHAMLDGSTPGEDCKFDGKPIKTRTRGGRLLAEGKTGALSTIEYLSDTPLLKEQARLMIGMTSKLKAEGGYTEWDGQKGDLLPAAYDWRLMPPMMEQRDGLFTKILEETEKMVNAHPHKLPAVVTGHSMGCKVAKYWLHFCHAAKGPEWMAQYVTHFVPLSGPWYGSVDPIRNTAIDGLTGEALDLMFSGSQLLTLCRALPVFRFLQPAGNWEDGLDLPFAYLRRELYLEVCSAALCSAGRRAGGVGGLMGACGVRVQVGIGGLESGGVALSGTSLAFVVNGTKASTR